MLCHTSEVALVRLDCFLAIKNVLDFVHSELLRWTNGIQLSKPKQLLDSEHCFSFGDEETLYSRRRLPAKPTTEERRNRERDLFIPLELGITYRELNSPFLHAALSSK